MKKYSILIIAVLAINFPALSQTKTVTVDANDALNNNTKIVAQTSVGQVFFTGHQLGAGYSNPLGIFRAWTDNPNGANNYFYDGVTNGITNFSVRADGQGYFAGHVGIGTTTPNETLDISGGLFLGNHNLDSQNINFLANSDKMLIGWNRTAGAGEMDFIANQGPGSTGGFAFYNHDNSNNENQLMWITGNGQVLIGNTQGKQGSYLLAVAGSAVATSFTVKTVANWPDYVFKQDYQLPSLVDVKTYIDQNHHLPEMPSAEQIEKDGLNLGEMNKLLTKKVEELTLYLIQKDQQIQNLQTELDKLRQQQTEIDTLKKDLEDFKKELKQPSNNGK